MTLTLKFVSVFFTLCVLCKCEKDYSAKETDYPYIAALEIKRGNNVKKTHCTGSIITSSWVITAAVCYRDADLSTIQTRVRAGTVDYDHKTEFTQDRKSLRYIVHDYSQDRDKQDANNDVALVQVDKPFTFNEYVNFIHIAKDFQLIFEVPEFMYPSCISLSFGLAFSSSRPDTEYGHRSGNKKGNSSQLFYLPTKAGIDEACNHYSPDRKWTGQHLCVFGTPRGYSVCRGEAGSPIVSGNTALIGTLSGDTRIQKVCPYDNFLVYMHTFTFEPWIRENIPELPETKLLTLILGENKKDTGIKANATDTTTTSTKSLGSRDISSIVTGAVSMIVIVVLI